ncbi:MAG: HAD family phosphatase [Sutterella sp.]|nr:HAD family phosphatase [Sutterella sp.]
MQFAIFDLDHTLLPIDSGDTWTRYLIRQLGDKAPELMQKAIDINTAYREGRFDADDAVRFQLSLLTYVPYDELLALRAAFLAQYVWPTITPSALELVAQCRRAGAHCVLASGTHRFVTGPIAARFGMDALIAATPEQDAQGEFTGRLVGSHSYGEGKRRLLEAYLASFSGPHQLRAFTDSINDLPLLEWVEQQGGEPVAVNPDPRLAQVAQRRGWTQRVLFAQGD